MFPLSSLTHQQLQWSWQRRKPKTSTWNSWTGWKSLRAGTVSQLKYFYAFFWLCVGLFFRCSHTVILSYCCIWGNIIVSFPSLHSHLVEHLNAEIVLQTISDVNMALDWIRSTFLYIRALKNPTYYGQSTNISKQIHVRISFQLHSCRYCL